VCYSRPRTTLTWIVLYESPDTPAVQASIDRSSIATPYPLGWFLQAAGIHGLLFTNGVSDTVTGIHYSTCVCAENRCVQLPILITKLIIWRAVL